MKQDYEDVCFKQKHVDRALEMKVLVVKLNIGEETEANG